MVILTLICVPILPTVLCINFVLSPLSHEECCPSFDCPYVIYLLLQNVCILKQNYAFEFISKMSCFCVPVPCSDPDICFVYIFTAAVTYSSECWAMKTNKKRKSATTETRMFLGVLGVSRLEHIRNEEIRLLLNLPPINEVMCSGRLRWFGRMQKREENNVTHPIINLALPGVRRRGRPRKTWKQQTREVMREVEVTVDMSLDHTEWRRRTRPTPCR